MVKEDQIFPNNLIKIGQKATDNDDIIRLAKETDIWFHLSALPSCHVIIEASSEFPIDKQMISYCAALVKQNTKYRNVPKVKVNYTAIRNVIRTDIPGKVQIKGKTNSIII